MCGPSCTGGAHYNALMEDGINTRAKYLAMHTNGGDRWAVRDRMWDKEVHMGRSRFKAEQVAAELNTSADFFLNKPRYELIHWDETNPGQ